MKNLILLSSLILIFTSCSSSNDDITDTPKEIPVLPTKIINSSSGLSSVKYSDNKITEITYTDSRQVYYYTGNLISKITDYDSKGVIEGTTTFVYSNDQLTGVSYVEGSSSSVYTYSYLNATTVNCVRTRKTNSQGGSYNIQDEFTYTLNGGNIVAVTDTYYLNNVKAGTLSETYTYDTKNNAFKNVAGWDKISLFTFDFNVMYASGTNTVLTRNQTNNQIGQPVSKYSVVNTVNYSTSNYPVQIVSKQYNASNQLNSTETNSFEFNK